MSTQSPGIGSRTRVSALVLDGSSRAALAVTRSLGRHGLRVAVADAAGRSLGGCSRFSESSHVYTAPDADSLTFLADLTTLCRQLRPKILVPVTDATIMLSSQIRLEGDTIIAKPRDDAYEAVTDKATLVTRARVLGVPVPRTHVATRAEEIAAMADELGFPLVLKPARSRYLDHGRIRSTAVRIVHSAAELPTIVAGCEWLAQVPCLVQEFIPGSGAGVFALFGPEGPVAWFAHRRIREKPPSGGVSVLSESSMVDPQLQDFAHRLLADAGWFGPAMVEFRVSREGKPYLMEVNGRFWGSLQLAVDSGVDFPWLLYQNSIGAPPEAAIKVAIGRRLRWFLGDIDHLILTLRDPQVPIATKLRTAARIMLDTLDPRIHPEVLRPSDPWPGLCEWKWWLADATRRTRAPGPVAAEAVD